MDTSPAVTADAPGHLRPRPRPVASPLHAAVGRIGAARRWRGPDHPDVLAAEREAAVIRLTMAAQEYRAVGMPAMEADEIEAITAILCGPAPVQATP